MADRTRTVVVARFTVEVEIEESLWQELSQAERNQVVGAAEDTLDQGIASLDERFSEDVVACLPEAGQKQVDAGQVSLFWDSEEFDPA